MGRCSLPRYVIVYPTCIPTDTPGHGMARILTATQSLAANIKTGEWDSRLPRVFEITEQRLEKGRSAAAIPRFQQS